MTIKDFLVEENVNICYGTRIFYAERDSTEVIWFKVVERKPNRRGHRKILITTIHEELAIGILKESA